ncbi:MAG: hypothetical protein ABSB99_10805 [Acidimicrobiales bacterium]|jgi:hypothetical protein
MVTPSAVVRVNRWVALPRLALPLPPVVSPVTPGTAGIIGHAMMPDPAESEAAVPTPERGDEGEAGDIVVALATCASPDCLVADDDNDPVAVNPTPVAPAATATTAAATRHEW